MANDDLSPAGCEMSDRRVAPHSANLMRETDLLFNVCDRPTRAGPKEESVVLTRLLEKIRGRQLQVAQILAEAWDSVLTNVAHRLQG